MISINKICTALVVSLSSLSSVAFANYDGGQYDGHFQNQGYYYGDDVVQGSVDGVDEFGFGMFSGGSFEVGVDVLGWTAKEDGLTYGAQSTTNADPITGFAGTGSATYKNFNFKWDAGYRARIKYMMTNAIEVGIEYTHFNTHADGKGASTATSFFYPTFTTSNLPVSTLTTGADGYVGHAKLNIDMIDLTFGHGYDFCRASFTPFAGFRFARVGQKSTSTSTTAPAVGTTAVESLAMHNNFEGAGLRGGMKSEYKLFKNISVNACAAFSALWGRNSTSYNSSTVSTVLADVVPVVGAPVVQSFTNHYQGFRGIADLGIGMAYDWEIACEQVLKISLGYEHHLFLNQNRYEVNGFGANLTPQSSNRGDLGTSGVTLGFDYKF